LDPQQRLLLEVASEALEGAAGAAPEGSSTGVFVGICTHDAAQYSVRDEAPDRVGVYTGTGNAFSTAAGRIAHTFGLRGPTVALVRKRLGDAQQAGDPILGLLRGSAVNHNGRGNGLTAPSPRAQVEVIRRALRDAGVAPGDLAYLEAFGSGTPLGDAVELRALG